MYVVGLDLSGPSNADDTALVAFDVQNEALRIRRSVLNATDRDILTVVSELAESQEVVVGIDAPLSYNPGGGDRPADATLRRQVIAAGLHPGSVMAPTTTRMVYLTLRGIAVARLLSALPRQPRIVEVHPGACMALRGALPDLVVSFKKSDDSRRELLAWLEQQGLKDVSDTDQCSDHFVAACAGALAAWKWRSGRTVWLEPAAPPFHPFDYAC